MKTREYVAVAGAAVLPVAVTNGGIVWDNGQPNGVNGYSNATLGVFGFRRTLLDDFQLTSTFGLDGLHWNSVWGTPMGGAMGVGAMISIRLDDGGMPGQRIAEANVTGYSETATGNILFSREEVEHWAQFDIIFLGPGRYWFEATVWGPENNFWLTADQQLNECWVNYEDLGGFQSGSDQFGTASDLNFRLSAIPGPGVIGLVFLAGVVGRRRRD